MGWTVWGSNPGGGEIFHTHPDQPWGPPSLLYNGYQVSFPGVKQPGRGVDHPPPSSAEVKERVALYLYSPAGPSWPVLGWIYLLPLCQQVVHLFNVSLTTFKFSSIPIVLHWFFSWIALGDVDLCFSLILVIKANAVKGGTTSAAWL